MALGCAINECLCGAAGSSVSEWLLGIGGSDHDFSAALIEGGRIRVAVEDERVQGVRHANTAWYAQPASDATAYCLEAADVNLEQLKGIFCCDDLDRPTPWLDWSTVTFINHHTAHAAASFFTAPHQRSSLLVIDGHGSAISSDDPSDEVETISIGYAEDSRLLVAPLQKGVRKRTSSDWQYAAHNSIGWFYEVLTMALGFGPHGQGKAMGLAGYGTPTLVDRMSGFVEIAADGRFRFDPYGGIWEWLSGELDGRPNAMQVRADIAYAGQEILVRAVVAAAKEAYRQFPSPVLSFGGGCALNTLANSRILEETPFEQLAVFPAAGDNGLSVGAALYGAHAILGWPRRQFNRGWRGQAVYTGREYRDDDVANALADAGVTVRRSTDLAQEAARALVAGEIVGVCRGRSEFGPRALGNRSLLALPFEGRTREHVNLEVKERESFRPLAPAVPFDSVGTYFEGVGESPHMLLVARVREQFRDRLAAVTHVDGTARVQTVRPEDNPFFHHVLKIVGAETGIPVLLNTSLNLPGKPIVETPKDAVEVFLRRPIDLLILGDNLVRKHTPWSAGPLATE
jgi:carbamoyltransferase